MLVIGRKGHVEVDGIVADLDHFDVIESADEVGFIPALASGHRLPDDGHRAAGRCAFASAVAARNPDAEIEFIDTVCLPTKEHQRALDRLLEKVEAVVVVGGAHSNNTLELVARCRDRGKPVLHVQSAADLDPAWFKPFATVGLTAGTSTLAETIDEVHRALVWIGGRGERAVVDATACSLAGGAPAWEEAQPGSLPHTGNAYDYTIFGDRHRRSGRS